MSRLLDTTLVLGESFVALKTLVEYLNCNNYFQKKIFI